MSVVVIATMTSEPELRASAIEKIVALTAAVHAEPGCELYAVHTSGKDRIVIIESWADKESLAAHAEGAAMADLKAALSGLVAPDTALEFLRPVVSGDPQRGVLVG